METWDEDDVNEEVRAYFEFEEAEALAALEKGLKKWFDEQGIDPE